MRIFQIISLLILLNLQLYGKDVKIGNQKFELAFTNITEKEVLKEYVLKGETLKNWSIMFSRREFLKIN